MKKEKSLRKLLIPTMLILSSAIMAVAWLGHLKYKEDLSFITSALFAWFLVLPEYLLNIAAIRWGVGVFAPSVMASINLASGIVFIALVSHYMLGEEISLQKYLGFGLMIVAMFFISSSNSTKTEKA
jgi:uncharacterized protein (DUF486 family)